MKNKKSTYTYEEVKCFKDEFEKITIDKSIEATSFNRKSLTRILNQFNSIYNKETDPVSLVTQYGPKNLAHFLAKLISSNKISYNYHDFIKDIKRFTEIDYRNFINENDINYSSFKDYMINLKNSITDFKNHDFYKYNKSFIYDFLCVRDCLGNPANWWSLISLEDDHKSYSSQDPIYLNFINDYLIESQFDTSTDSNSVQYNPCDVFYELANLTIEEILYQVNCFFDINFDLFMNSPKLLNKIIKELDNLCNEYQIQKLNGQNFDEYHISSFLTVLDIRKNRDHFFESIEFLCNIEDYSNSDFYKNNPKNPYNSLRLKKSSKIEYSSNLNNKDLITYISEINISSKGFNKNRKIIEDLATASKILQENLSYYSPAIKIELKFNKLLNYKVIYHEMFTLKDDYKFVLKSVKQQSNQVLNLANCLKMIILTANNYSKFLNNEDLKKYGKTYDKLIFEKQNFLYEENEDSNIVYKMNILLSEKIRRGFYREFDLMNQYKLIYNFKKKLRKTLTNLFYHSNLNDVYIDINCLYDNILNIMEIH